MRRIAAVLALGLVTLAAPIPMAHAAAFTYTGGCHLVATDATGAGTWNGVVWMDVVPTDANGAPSGASVSTTCGIAVNGNEAIVLGPRFGIGESVDAGLVPPFTAYDTDTIEVCEHVTVGGTTLSNCHGSTVSQVPPQEILDLLEQVLCLVFSDAICHLIVPGSSHVLLSNVVF